jgi:hypothetical protein
VTEATLAAAAAAAAAAASVPACARAATPLSTSADGKCADIALRNKACADGDGITLDDDKDNDDDDDDEDNGRAGLTNVRPLPPSEIAAAVAAVTGGDGADSSCVCVTNAVHDPSNTRICSSAVSATSAARNSSGDSPGKARE